MEECVHEIWMPPLPANINKGHNSRMGKVVKYKINVGLSFMVPDLVYKF